MSVRGGVCPVCSCNKEWWHTCPILFCILACQQPSVPQRRHGIWTCQLGESQANQRRHHRRPRLPRRASATRSVHACKLSIALHRSGTAPGKCRSCDAPDATGRSLFQKELQELQRHEPVEKKDHLGQPPCSIEGDRKQQAAAMSVIHNTHASIRPATAHHGAPLFPSTGAHPSTSPLKPHSTQRRRPSGAREPAREGSNRRQTAQPRQCSKGNAVAEAIPLTPAASSAAAVLPWPSQLGGSSAQRTMS